MKVVATYNIKGGVGKTAAAVNLSYLAALNGQRVLLWDLDPQGAATYYFRIKPKIKGGSKKLLLGQTDINGLIKGSDFDRLDILPADFSYRNIDLLLDGTKNPTRHLRRLIKPLSAQYDLIVFDCAPNISLASEAVFFATDLLLVPVIPTPLSIRTLDQLLKFGSDQNFRRLRVLPFCSMVDRRKSLHRALQESLPQDYEGMLNTAVPYSSDIEKMGIERMPLPAFAGNSRAGMAYQQLWDEVDGHLQRLDGERNHGG